MDTQGATRVRRVSLMGVAEELPIIGGHVAVPIEHEPHFLVFDNATAGSPGTAQPILKIESAGVLVDGRDTTASVKLANPGNVAVMYQYRWEAGSGVSLIGPSKGQIQIEPGGTRPLDIKVRLIDASKTADHEALTLIWSQTGGPESRTEVPLIKATAVANTPPSSRPPDYTLDQAAQVVNTNNVDPETHRFSWKGPDDLSASVWLTNIGQQFNVRVEVEDDQHQQTHTGSNIWQGDSVQLAIAHSTGAGFWEIGLALGPEGVAAHRWGHPKDVQDGDPIVKASASRDGTKTIYELSLDSKTLGIEASTGSDGVFRFNILVNDDDEDRREGWIQLTEGLAGPKSPELFIPLILDHHGSR